MENKYHREITAEEKMSRLLQVWTGAKKVGEICKEMGISKEAYYQWERKAKAAMAEALEKQKTGRPEKDYVAEERLREELNQLRNKLTEQQVMNKKLEKEQKKTESELWMARHVIEFWKKEGLVEIKKNGFLGRVLRRIFSKVPKKRSGQEEQL